MNEQAEQIVKCGAVKTGGVTLRCELERKHEGWHKAVYTDHREIVYDGAHHEIHLTETVTWEPVDHVAESVRHLMTARDGA